MTLYHYSKKPHKHLKPSILVHDKRFEEKLENYKRSLELETEMLEISYFPYELNETDIQRLKDNGFIRWNIDELYLHAVDSKDAIVSHAYLIAPWKPFDVENFKIYLEEFNKSYDEMSRDDFKLFVPRKIILMQELYRQLFDIDYILYDNEIDAKLNEYMKDYNVSEALRFQLEQGNKQQYASNLLHLKVPTFEPVKVKYIKRIKLD